MNDKNKKNHNGLHTKKGLSNVIVLFLSLILALIMGGVFFLVCGYSPVDAYVAIFYGAFGSLPAFIMTLTQATPLIFSGLAFAVAMRGGMLNVGTEGQLFIGAFVAAVAGAYIKGLPAYIHILVVLILAAVAGGLWGALVGFLKVYFGSNEVITTIMLNFVALNLTGYMVNYPLKAQGMMAQTKPILDTAKLQRLFPQYPLSTAILIAVLTVIVITFIFCKTPLGYEIEVTGRNRRAAETAGIRINRIVIITMFLSGAIAGLGGAGQIVGINHCFVDGFSPGYGFEGVAVSALVANNPAMTVFSGILFGAIKAGAITVNRIAHIPMDFVFIIQALVVIFVAAPKLVGSFLNVFGKIGKKEGISNGKLLK